VLGSHSKWAEAVAIEAGGEAAGSPEPPLLHETSGRAKLRQRTILAMVEVIRFFPALSAL
ncbi:MAG TPA: hypothetical protein VN638_09195, partial [Nitrospiraceae bacterium]|nr:hypothetical protein [Nitrospiraceae bacterium]